MADARLAVRKPEGRRAVIRRQSHSAVYVTDQQEALKFYRDELGFEVRTDVSMDHEGAFRWLTMSPKGQTDLGIVLMPIAQAPALDAGKKEQMMELVRSGALGIGVFETDGIHERLSRQGVDVVSPPKEQFYGVEALVKDNSGNFFSLTQRKG